MSKKSLFNQASEAWELGNLKKAFRLFYEAAKQGDASAQNNLGFFYDEGKGTKRNQIKALYWYKKAARNGESYSCMNIAKMYQKNGNINRARLWLNKAIAQGDGDAALELAKLYLASKRRDNLNKAIKHLRFVIRSKQATDDSRDKACLILRQIKNK